MDHRAKRQRARMGVLLVSFALFPVTIFYFSPYLIVWGAFQGVAAAVVARQLKLTENVGICQVRLVESDATKRYGIHTNRIVLRSVYGCCVRSGPGKGIPWLHA